MGAAEKYNPNTLDQDQVAALLGYKTAGRAEQCLLSQGIKPFYGRPGYWFITIDQLNAARGILKGQPEPERLEDDFG